MRFVPSRSLVTFIAIIQLFGILCVPYAAQARDKGNYLFKELRQKTQLKSRDVLVVLWLQPGECLKCVQMFPQSLACACANLIDSDRVKSIALIACNREKELLTLTSLYGWPFFALMDDGSSRDKLVGKSSDARLVFFAEDGSLLGVLSNELFTDGSCKVMRRTISKFLQKK